MRLVARAGGAAAPLLDVSQEGEHAFGAQVTDGQPVDRRAREQWVSARDVHRAPFHDRTAALGAGFHEARGWERPQWYSSNQDLVEHYGVADRPHEWDRRWWSPIRPTARWPRASPTIQPCVSNASTGKTS